MKVKNIQIVECSKNNSEKVTIVVFLSRLSYTKRMASENRERGRRRHPPVRESDNKVLSSKGQTGFRNQAVTMTTEKAPGYTNLEKDPHLYEDLPRSQGYEDVGDPGKASYVNVS